MFSKTRIAGMIPFVFAVALIGGEASAAVVGFSPSIDLRNQDYTVGLDDSTSYTFSNSGEGGSFGFGLAAVETTGNAMVGSTFGSPSVYFTDPSRAPFVDDNLFTTYRSYDDPATIRLSERDSFIALRFMLQDGVHFGFARLAGLTLFDFAYETEAGKGIQAGPGPFTSPAPVPLPAGFPLLIAALGGLGLVRHKRKAA
ncbi:VPLPA-CTERM sorting domain-containing protein [Paracoccus sp. TK19116]|uniref:VPLPA-CTERM sorting domain-containing protein n=1 Tax=Paracoccus albicereus TaxID=2922394 RepID=A0ABT1MV59_9RHOB|nr:VPLPA-CTERM sorting domain-containing protein [Paracoccus albicereus]MCQ0972167.1 VPLPA-CTERM sorting domain-containing protein [Paracoccus albicereus]